MMEALKRKILVNLHNEKVFKFLNIDVNEKIVIFENWDIGIHGFDEGACIFFDNYGKDVPKDCKYIFGTTNIMINPENGEIFAFHTGRFSIFYQCDFERSKLINCDDYRRGYTFDCISDITELGTNWSFLIAEFDGEFHEQFRWAFEKVSSKM